MENKKQSILKCTAYALGMYAALSFLWTAILSFGMSLAAENAKAISDTAVESSGISEFATRLVKADGAFALFALIFGFSFLVFQAKNMSQTAKRTIHVLVNYVAAMVVTYIVHNISSAQTSAVGWVSMIVIWSFVYFIIYGLCMLASFIVRKIKD
jgi:hypothetical protein